MQPPKDGHVEIHDQKRYNTATATLIADDCYWDGHNHERHGRNTFLYCTKRGNYFTFSMSQWQSERDTIRPIDIDEAVQLYQESLPNHAIEFEAAFPGVAVSDA